MCYQNWHHFFIAYYKLNTMATQAHKEKNVASADEQKKAFDQGLQDNSTTSEEAKIPVAEQQKNQVIKTRKNLQ